MGYEKKTWKNRQSEYPNRRTLTPVSGQENTYDVARAEGLVMEEGDAFDQQAMNDLEERISSGFKQLRSVTVTLPASGWQGSTAPYTQQIAVEGMTAEWNPGTPVAVPGTLDNDGLIALQEALGALGAIESKEGSLLFTCPEEKPSVNMTLRVPGI